MLIISYRTYVFVLQEVETEDMMDELIGRSLVTSNTSNEDDEKKTCYFVHDIQLGFIKEKMTEKKKIKGFHQLLIDRFVFLFLF